MQKPIKLLFQVLGVFIFLVFVAPLLAGILNIGNAFGMGVGAMLFAIGLFLDKIISFSKNKVGKILVSTFCIVAIVGFSLFGATLTSVVKTAYSIEENCGNTLVVLGCKVRGETPSLQLYKRALAGVDYLNANPDAVAVLCGGKGSDERISEAECIKRIMLENSIDESRLYVEDKSTSTEENLSFAKDIINQNDLDKSVVISTSDYHCYRARLIAKKMGMDAKTIPAHADRFSLPTFFTREVFGVWLQYLK